MYGGGGGDDALAARLGMMTSSLLKPVTSSMISGEMSPAPGREERAPAQPQWSQQETREFIAIRAELERDFTASKRNKTLWEVVSSNMRERGYRRSPEQCKCKWKNLVNRYKVPLSLSLCGFHLKFGAFRVFNHIIYNNNNNILIYAFAFALWFDLNL